MEENEKNQKNFEEHYKLLVPHLKELNYSRRTLNRYSNHSEDIIARLKASGKEDAEFTTALCEWIMQDIIGGRSFPTLSLKEKNEINSLQAILSYSETGSLSLFGRPNKVFNFDGPLGTAISEYLDRDRKLGRTQKTIDKKSRY